MDKKKLYVENVQRVQSCTTSPIRQTVAPCMHLFSIRLLLIVSADSIAEFSFETNASPSGGHLESDRLSATAGVDELRLQSLGWTDDVDDFPLTHSFGYLHGYQEQIAIGR